MVERLGARDGAAFDRGEPMKLAVWHNLMWSRYKAAVFTELASQAESRGDEVIVYQIAETDSDRVGLSEVELGFHRYPHVQLFKGSYDRIGAWRLARKTARLTIADRSDVTLIAGIDRPEYWIQAAILWALRRKRAVFCDSTAFDQPPTFLKNVVKRIFFTLVPDVLCYGERASAYVRTHGAKPGRVHFRRQAAALSESYEAGRIPARRRAAAPAPDAPVFLYAGRLAAIKRIDDLIHAFDRFAERWPKARLRIVGAGSQEQKLRAIAAALPRGEQVEFVGARSGKELVAEYLGATALVLPSWSEPWGLVVNEALHYGCPVIVSDRCGCVPELVESTDCGLVFACGDRGDLAAKLELATREFADAEAVAGRCLAKIAPYNSAAAAADILAVAHRIAAR